MSVGHIAREIESSGIPTVSVYVRSFRHVAESMGVPRTVSPAHIMGRPMGAPGDNQRHDAVVAAAFRLLESATVGGEIVDLDEPYIPGKVG